MGSQAPTSSLHFNSWKHQRQDILADLQWLRGKAIFGGNDELKRQSIVNSPTWSPVSSTTGLFCFLHPDVIRAKCLRRQRRAAFRHILLQQVSFCNCIV